MIQSIIEHFEALGDIQTLAMILCVLTIPHLSNRNEKKYNTEENFEPDSRNKIDKINFQQKKEETKKKMNDNEDNCCLLDPALSRKFDLYKLAYADILLRWMLFNQREEILKFVLDRSLIDSGVSISIKVFCKCERTYEDNYYCKNCNRMPFVCSICKIPVKKLSLFCNKCGHGGHTNHMMNWFQTEISCPTPGCSCTCAGEVSS